jgi:hypothetical protein
MEKDDMTAQQAATNMEVVPNAMGRFVTLIIVVVGALCYVAWRFWPV